MVHCCVPGCKNTHHTKSKKDDWGKAEPRNYSLHDLPSEDRMDIRELWVMAIHRTSLPKDVAVCSDHFTEDCFDEKWEEYKRKYGPTKVIRKLKLDAVPTIFPGRIFIHEKINRIKESWKNKDLQRQVELERLRIEREYKDRFKMTQTTCTCKCRCKTRIEDFSQQVNFQFKFMKDVGVQFPKDLTQTVKEDHSYTQGKFRNTSKSVQAVRNSVPNESTRTGSKEGVLNTASVGVGTDEVEQPTMVQIYPKSYTNKGQIIEEENNSVSQHTCIELSEKGENESAILSQNSLERDHEQKEVMIVPVSGSHMLLKENSKSEENLSPHSKKVKRNDNEKYIVGNGTLSSTTDVKVKSFISNS